jgi:Zinc-finger associated domain (zf-AD)
MVNKTKTCRCCLSEINSFSDLFEFSSEVSVDENNDGGDPQNFVKISEVWQNITLVDVEASDEYEEVSKICSSCLSDLKFCYLFQKRCLESEKIYNDGSGGERFLTQFCIINLHLDLYLQGNLCLLKKKLHLSQNQIWLNTLKKNSLMKKRQTTVLRTKTECYSSRQKKTMRLTRKMI